MSPKPLLSDLSLILLAATVLLAFYVKYLARPSPLVHPLLLGSQADISPTRERGQSGIYRSWGTGHGSPLALRPSNNVRTVANVLDSKTDARFIYGTKISNELLRLRAGNIAKGLRATLSTMTEGPATRGILNLLPDSFDSLLLTLSQAVSPASSSHPLITLASPTLLAHVLDLPLRPALIVLPATLLQAVLEQLIDDSAFNGTSVVIIGSDNDLSDVRPALLAARDAGIPVVDWREIERTGDTEADDGKSADITDRDVLTVLYSYGIDGTPQELPLTHLSLTAGMSALLSLFSAHKRPGPGGKVKDTIVSSLPLGQPAGLALALAAIWSGTGFRTFGTVHGWDTQAGDLELDLAASAPLVELQSLMDPAVSAPTIAFLTRDHLQALTTSLSTTLARNPLSPLALRHAYASLSDGFISRGSPRSLINRLVWSPARRSTLGGLPESLRATIVLGPPSASPELLREARAVLGMPITRLTTHGNAASQLFVSHFLDVQDLPSQGQMLPQGHVDGAREFAFTPTSSSSLPGNKGGRGVGEGAHTGPPSSNVEILLKGLDEEAMAGAAAGQAPLIEGEVWARGPGVVSPTQKGVADTKGFIPTGLRARVMRNGCFVLL